MNVDDLHLSLTPVTPPIRGDLNGDGSIDAADVQRFIECVTGAEVPITDPGCTAADMDDDGDADLSDFGRLQRCITAPGEPADPNCA
jgi:hypothetical protein